MIKNSTVLLFTFFIVLSGYSQSQINKEAGRKIDSIFASYSSQTPGAAIVVVKDGKVVFKKGYGTANLNYNIPITTQTVFDIASVSKQFTAFTIYLLESEGKLSFEDEVKKYIPELPDYAEKIKIKHLLAHTGGLRDQGALGSIAGYLLTDMTTTQQILKMLNRQSGLLFTPGSAFAYCNSGYVLLAEIVQRITGKTFSAYTKEKIFIPLGMNATLFCDDYQLVIKNKADSYEKNKNAYYYKPSLSTTPGPSGLLTTVEDLVKWVLNFDNPVVGNKALIERFNEVSYFDNGSKVFLRVIDGDTIFHAKGQNLWKHKGVRIISHGGHTAGFRTFLGRFPNERLAIIQLSNDEHNERLGGRWDIADYYIKDQLKEQTQSPVTATARPGTGAATIEFNTPDISVFTGRYYSEELEARYSFEVNNNRLVMRHIRLDDIVLKRTGEYKFSGDGPNTFAFEITFTKDETGKFTGFYISNWGAKNVKFLKQD